MEWIQCGGVDSLAPVERWRPGGGGGRGRDGTETNVVTNGLGQSPFTSHPFLSLPCHSFPSPREMGVLVCAERGVHTGYDTSDPLSYVAAL